MAGSGRVFAAQTPQAAPERSPDSKIGLAENGNRLADSEIMTILQ